jgi:hypothetical protein
LVLCHHANYIHAPKPVKSLFNGGPLSNSTFSFVNDENWEDKKLRMMALGVEIKEELLKTPPSNFFF